MRIAFDRGGDLVHHRHRFHWKGAGGGFGRQHHRIGAVEHRIGDVGHFGAGRHRRGDHRLQHLGRHHHRLTGLAGHLGDQFLFAGNFLNGEFDAEIAARHHDGVGEVENFRQPVDRPRLFDFGHAAGAVGYDLPEVGHVVGALHEAERHPIDAQLHRGIKVAAVLLGHGRNRQHRIGQVDALLVLEDAADFDDGFGPVFADIHDLEADFAVVDQDDLAGLNRCEDFGMRYRNVVAAFDRHLAHQAQLVAVMHFALVARQRTETDFRALQIGQDADRAADIFLEIAHDAEFVRQISRRVVAHVDAEDIGARFEQRFDHFGRRAGWPERCQNLGFPSAPHECFRVVLVRE